MDIKNGNMENNWEDKLDLTSFYIPEGKGKAAVWQTILENINQEQEKKSIPIWGIVSKLAAVFVGLALVTGMLWVMVFGRTDYFSPAGKHLAIELPDGSKVNLNAATRLSFNKYLWYFSRNVDLDGEAMFTVTKGKTFNVQTGVVTTQVLGTTFNVYARNNEVRVNCIEGSVAVIHSLTKQRVQLTSSQKTALTEGNLEEPVDVFKAEMISWTKGEFFYFNENLDDVLQELERQFNVIIKKTYTTKRYYSGVFYNRNLAEALDLVCIPMQLKWEKINGTIVISEQE